MARHKTDVGFWRRNSSKKCDVCKYQIEIDPNGNWTSRNEKLRNKKMRDVGQKGLEEVWK